MHATTTLALPFAARLPPKSAVKRLTAYGIFRRRCLGISRYSSRCRRVLISRLAMHCLSIDVIIIATTLTTLAACNAQPLAFSIKAKRVTAYYPAASATFRLRHADYQIRDA